ncbi:MAG: hypothetical protein U0640_11650 [Phycisphaerales bacterium]
MNKHFCLLLAVSTSFTLSIRSFGQAASDFRRSANNPKSMRASKPHVTECDKAKECLKSILPAAELAGLDCSRITSLAKQLGCLDSDNLSTSTGESPHSKPKAINGSAVDEFGNPVFGKEEKPKMTSNSISNNVDSADSLSQVAAQAEKTAQQLIQLHGSNRELVESVKTQISSPDEPNSKAGDIVTSPTSTGSELSDEKVKDNTPYVYKASVGPVSFGFGQDKAGWYHPVIGLGLGTAGVSATEDGLSVSAWAFGASAQKGYVETGQPSAGVSAFAGPGGTVEANAQGIRSKAGVGLGASADVDITLPAPFQSKFLVENTERIEKPRWYERYLVPRGRR